MSLSTTLARHRKNLYVRTARLLARLAPGFFSRRLRRPVFVVGCARSGTTLVAAILGDHPEIAEWSEANDVWDPGWYPWRPELFHKLPLEVDPEGFTERWWRENASRRQEIAAAFGAYQTLARRPVLVNKSPFHTFRIPQLLEMFPDARFVHVVRDGRAVAHSYRGHLQGKGKLREWPLELRRRYAEDGCALLLHLARFWRRALDEVTAQDRRLVLAESGRLAEVSYEELVSAPDRVLERLHRFLGVAHRPLDPGRWRLQNQNHKWREVLPDDWRQAIEAEIAAELDRRGYR